jgi:hypothetical protein
MSQMIADYMHALATDPAKLAAFRADRTAAMTAFGLSAEDQAIVQQGPAAIQAAVARVDPQGAQHMQIVM